MFVASDNELREFTLRLLESKKSKQVIEQLEKQDEKQLRFVKISMQQKMPAELASSKYQVGPVKESEILREVFPKMFNFTNKKTYEYIDDDLENIKMVAATFGLIPKVENTSIAEDRCLEETIKPQEIHQDVEKKDGTALEKIESKIPLLQQQPEQSKEKKSSKSRSNSQQPPKQLISSNTQQSRFVTQPSRVNPFIENRMNFSDPNANSKSLQKKYAHLSYTQNSRNMVAMVQSSKYNAFSNSGSFPTSVMAGAILAPKETSFSKQAKLDIGDVMRYTLGVVKKSGESEKMQNPFNRPPKKRNE